MKPVDTKTNVASEPIQNKKLRSGISVSSSFASSFDVAKIKSESLEVAKSVSSYAASGDKRSIEIAALDISQYSNSVKSLLNSQTVNNFFNNNNVQEPSTAEKEIKKAGVSIDSCKISFNKDSGILDAFSVEIEVSVPEFVQDIILMRRDNGLISDLFPMSKRGMDLISSHVSDFMGGSQFSDVELATTVSRIPVNDGKSIGVTSFSSKDDKSSDVRPFLQQTENQSTLSVKLLKGVVNPATASYMDASLVYDINTIERLSKRQNEVSKNDKLDEKEDNKPKEFKSIGRHVTTQTKKIRIVDKSVIRGYSYSYYAYYKNKTKDSLRSQIVSINVDKTNQVIQTPTVYSTVLNTSILLNVGIPTNIEKIEVYRENSNAWSIIGSVDASSAGCVFTDKNVRPGINYSYRVYAVDPFGNKSQVPATCTARIPVGLYHPVLPPTLSVGVDRTTGRSFIDIFVEDKNTKIIRISRKDISLYEKQFSIIGGQGQVSLGVHDKKRSQDGSLRDISSTQNGILEINGPGHYKFYDVYSRVDHTYQYSCVAIDKSGRTSIDVATENVFVSKKPLITPPSTLSASIDKSDITLSWVEQNLAVSPDEMLGNRETLSFHSVRNLYQVQRMNVKNGKWISFPLVDTISIIDSSNEIIDGRPEAPVVGNSYMYRVATFQTGGYYSSYTDPILVEIKNEVKQIVDLKASLVDFNVKLSFNSDGFDGEWRIEKATIGAKNSIVEDFVTLGSIYRECSRMRSQLADKICSLNKKERIFIDSDVQSGKNYLYRVTPITKDGIVGKSETIGISLAKAVK